MVERIKDAITKARQERETQRQGTGSQPVSPPSAPTASPRTKPGTGTMSVGGSQAAQADTQPGHAGDDRSTGFHAVSQKSVAGAQWDDLTKIELDPKALEANRVISHSKSDPAHVPVDILRTKLLKEIRSHSWKRVAITSPTAGCGKTFMATNLACSLARQPTLRTMLIDYDLRKPQVESYVGSTERKSLERFLTGEEAVQDYFFLAGQNLVLGLNSYPIKNSSELIHDEKTKSILSGAIEALAPDVVILDLPPLLTTDDVLAFVSNVDCVILVVAAGETTADEIDECERQLSKLTTFLGVVLNKCNTSSADVYDYGYS